MPDSAFQPEHFVFASDVVRQLSLDLEIQFQLEGEKWDRETMQKHVNKRAALITTQNMLLNEGERVLKATK